MNANSLLALLARTPGLTAVQAHALLAAAQRPHAALRDPAVLTAAGLSAPAIAFLTGPVEPLLQSDLRWIETSGARLVSCADPDYPPLLARTRGAPAVLFVLGDVAALQSTQLAMVGSRSPTPSGRHTAQEFAAQFVRAGLTVTSGLATGIDRASHEGALLGAGQTVAVLGNGLDRVYPPECRELAERIRERGALVSAFPPGTRPLRINFPRRNRIISGLSRGTLVIEAAARSGSLLTARYAREQGRPVFAIPGSIHSRLSRGCHELIRSGAKLVDEPRQVLLELGIPFTTQRLTVATRHPVAAAALDKEYEMLLDALGFESATLDVLVARTHLSAAAVTSMLLILELEGCVAALPGGQYGRIPK